MSLTELSKHYKTKQCQAISNMSILCVKTNRGDSERVYVCTCTFKYTYICTEYFWKDTQ